MGIGSDATDEIYDDQLNALSQILLETYVDGVTQSSIVQFAESIDINHEFLDAQTAQTVSDVMKNLPIVKFFCTYFFTCRVTTCKKFVYHAA